MYDEDGPVIAKAVYEALFEVCCTLRSELSDHRYIAFYESATRTRIYGRKPTGTHRH